MTSVQRWSKYLQTGREDGTKNWRSLGGPVLLPTISLILNSGICCFFLKDGEVNQTRPQNTSAAAASKISWKFCLLAEWSILHKAEEMKPCCFLLWRYYFICSCSRHHIIVLCGYISASFSHGYNPKFRSVMKNPASWGFLVNQNIIRF